MGQIPLKVSKEVFWPMVNIIEIRCDENYNNQMKLFLKLIIVFPRICCLLNNRSK